MSGEREKDTTWPGLSGLFRNAFSEIWVLGHLQYYVWRWGGREGGWTGGRVRGRSGGRAQSGWMIGRASGRASAWTGGRALGRAGGSAGRAAGTF